MAAMSAISKALGVKQPTKRQLRLGVRTTNA